MDENITDPVALWFPDTLPPAGMDSCPPPFGRLLFFRPLASGGEEVLGPGLAGFNPVPGPDCEALAGVVAGVEASGEEFVMGQLAAMNAPPRRGEDGLGLAALIGRLRRPEDGRASGEDRPRTTLNRARLLLALDELRRRQEDDIARELARAEEKERELLGELASVSGSAAAVPRASVPSGDRGRLVRAWFMLFFRSAAELPRLLVCGREDAAFLAESCGADPVASVPLPAPGRREWPEGPAGEFAALAAGPDAFPQPRLDELFRELAAAGDGPPMSLYLLTRGELAAGLGMDGGQDEKRGERCLLAALSPE